MTSIKDANRDEQDIYDRDQNRPEQKSEDGIKEGRNSQETAADAPSPVTADTIDVMVSYGQDRCMVWRRWITMLPPTQSMAGRLTRWVKVVAGVGFEPTTFRL